MLNVLLGLHLRGLRRKQGLSIYDMADRLQYRNQNFVSSVERARQPIPLSKVLDYAVAYDADRVFFPRVVLWVWHPGVWRLFKTNLVMDDHWEHVNGKHRWEQLRADEELQEFLFHETVRLGGYLREPDHALLRELMSQLRDAGIREPEPPLEFPSLDMPRAKEPPRRKQARKRPKQKAT